MDEDVKVALGFLAVCGVVVILMGTVLLRALIADGRERKRIEKEWKREQKTEE